MHKNITHMKEVMLELDENANFNFKNRMVKQALNTRIQAQKKANEQKGKT